MRTEKSAALKLRLAGKSYSEIQKVLGVPKATLSLWLRSLPLSAEARHKIIKKHRDAQLALKQANEYRRVEAAQRAFDARSAGTQTIARLSFRDLMIAGSMLYWAEGYKKPISQNGKIRTYHTVRLTTGDPSMIGLFGRFLHIVCGVRQSDIKVALRVADPKNMVKDTELFAKKAGIPLSQVKTTLKKALPIKDASQARTVAELTVHNTALYHTIMGFIDGLMEAR